MSQNAYGYRANRKKRSRRRAKRIQRIRHMMQCTVAIIVVCTGMMVLGRMALSQHQEEEQETAEDFLQVQGQSHSQGLNLSRSQKTETYPQELQELLEKNEETYEFVSNYPNRDKYQGGNIDSEKDIVQGQVPLLLQWDMRWGYDSYGKDMIAVAGCGPTCMSMAYVYLTEDTSMNPRKMAEFAMEGGYNTEVGTSWNFFTEGAGELGLQGQEISLAEATMKGMLDTGGVVICSMRPGDFTTSGHFILIRGYDENGFWVNDPNSKKNSGKQWEFDTLSGQIKCLWGISAGD